MAKAPSKHGLEKKFKPWRKGKSAKVKLSSSKEKSSSSISSSSTSTAVKKGGRSLKNQLRSKERFLSRLIKNSNTDNNDKNDTKLNALKKEVERDIQEIKEEIQKKGEIERQKKIAAKYHQIKFFERQRLTRMERKARKKLEEAKHAADFEDIANVTRELEQISMDQLYVAYFPNDTKYLSIFGPGGERVRDVNKKVARQREEIKKNILIKIKSGDLGRRSNMKSWVNVDVLRARDFDLSLAKGHEQDEGSDNLNNDDIKNDRFEAIKKRKAKDDNLSSTASKREKRSVSKGKKNRKKSASTSNCDSSSDDDISSEDDNEKVDKMNKAKNPSFIPAKKNTSESNNNDDNSDSRSSDSSSSSSSSSSDSDSSSSDSDSDSSGTSGASDEKEIDQQQQQKDPSQSTKLQDRKEEDEESEDDFLVDDDGKTDMGTIFSNAWREVQSYSEMQGRGDKSKGWQTQRQRPGEWKGERYNKKYI